MGQTQSRRATESDSAIEKRPTQRPVRQNPESECQTPRAIVRPCELVKRDPDTAVRRMLPMAHQKMSQLPYRIEAVCLLLGTCSNESGPDGGLASSVRDLCDAMKRIYRYLCNPSRTSKRHLPFSGAELAEAMGILALKVERYVRDFETARREPIVIESMAERARGLAEHCEQTTTVLLSIKSDKRLEPRSRWSTEACSRSRHGTSDSVQPGMGRSIFGV